MRIISGNFKGKKLFVPLNKNTRPLKDLVKESIFNLINHSKNINLEIENYSDDHLHEIKNIDLIWYKNKKICT